MPLPMLGSALLFCLVLWFAYGELAQLANAKKSQQQYTPLIYCFYRSFLNTEKYIAYHFYTSYRFFNSRITTAPKLRLLNASNSVKYAVKTAVVNGELDTQIDAATNKLRDGFAQ